MLLKTWGTVRRWYNSHCLGILGRKFHNKTERLTGNFKLLPPRYLPNFTKETLELYINWLKQIFAKIILYLSLQAQYYFWKCMFPPLFSKICPQSALAISESPRLSHLFVRSKGYIWLLVLEGEVQDCGSYLVRILIVEKVHGALRQCWTSHGLGPPSVFFSKATIPSG